MGRIKNGIFGGVTGRIANLVGYELNGQNVIRTVARSRKPDTVKQLNNKLQMKVIVEFLDGIESLLRMGFNPLANGTTKNFHNLAIAHNKPHALTGFYPDVEIDYPKIVFSKGNLLQPVNTTYTIVDQHLEFTWDKVNDSDQVMLLAYAPNSKRAAYEDSGAKRGVGKERLKLKPGMADEPLELYISFVSKDRTQVANSLYLGRI